MFEHKFGKRDKFKVDEISGGAAVNNYSGFDNLIAHRKFDRNVYGSFIGQGYKYMINFMGRWCWNIFLN